MYRADKISKSIGKASVLRDVSLSCQPGEAIAVIGPNGSGKTVLLKALSFADPPSAGTIEVDGAHFKFPSGPSNVGAAPWPQVTFVFQQLFLWPHLTIQANISLPAELRTGDQRAVRKRVRELAAELGITEILSRYPNQVSGGQRQRTAIARALILEPKWLFLDEPNSALDVEQVNLLEQIITRGKRNGMGIIFSTHLFGFAAAVADRVVFLDSGQMIETGTIDILSQPKTERMKRFISIVEHRRVPSGASA
jgi:ABC-type polar amino acid transport system ATPase subunit